MTPASGLPTTNSHVFLQFNGLISVDMQQSNANLNFSLSSAWLTGELPCTFTTTNYNIDNYQTFLNIGFSAMCEVPNYNITGQNSLVLFIQYSNGLATYQPYVSIYINSQVNYVREEDVNIDYNQSSLLSSISSYFNDQNATIITKTNEIINILQNQTSDNTNRIVSAQEDTTNAVEDNTQAVNDLNDTISDDDISGNGADDFFSDFQNNDHGLSSIITAPLSFIQNLSSSNCSPISLTLPFVSETFNLPCMSTIYSTNFGNLFSLYRTVVFGIVAYYICVRIYTLVKGFKDPQDDRIEVLDL